MVRRKYVVATKRQKKKWSSQMSYVQETLNVIQNQAGPYQDTVFQYTLPIVVNRSSASVALSVMKVKNFKVSLTIANFRSFANINNPAGNANLPVKLHISLCYFKQNQPPVEIDGITQLSRSYLYTCPEYVIATKVVTFPPSSLGQSGEVNANLYSQVSWNVSSRLARNLQTGDGLFFLLSTFPLSSEFNTIYHIQGAFDAVVRYWTVSQ